MIKSRRRTQSGFTAAELMVGLAILGILAAVSVPNLRSYRESQRMASAGDQIASVCRSAQARARSENHNIVIEYRTEGNEIAVIDDENNNNLADADEEVLVFPFPDGVSLSGTTFPNDRLIFNNRGRATSGGNILLSGRSEVTPKQVRVSLGTGRVKVMSGSGS